MNTQFTQVAFKDLDRPLFNEKKCFENGKRLKTLLMSHDRQNKNIEKANQQRKRTVFTQHTKQMQKQRQQKAKKTGTNDDKHIGKLYKKTIRRTQGRTYIKKNQLGENINILNIKEIEGFNQDQFFNVRKSKSDAAISNAKVEDLARVIDKIENEVEYNPLNSIEYNPLSSIQYKPLSSIQYPHLQDIRREIQKNNQWASIYSKKKQETRGKANILKFQKRKAQKSNNNKKPRRCQTENQVYDSVPKTLYSRDRLQLSKKKKNKTFLKKATSLGQSFKRDSIFSQNINSFNKFYDYDKKNCRAPSHFKSEKYINMEQDLINVSTINHKINIGTQHNIQFQKLTPKQKFLLIESQLRQLYSQKMPLSHPSTGYYTNKRVQGLYQCQLMRNSKKIFGSSKYLYKMGKLMKQVKNKEQTVSNQGNNFSKKYIESIKANSSQQTLNNHCYSKKMFSNVNKRHMGGQISQVEIVLQKNKQRIQQQRKRTIQKLRC